MTTQPQTYFSQWPTPITASLEYLCNHPSSLALIKQTIDPSSQNNPSTIAIIETDEEEAIWSEPGTCSIYLTPSRFVDWTLTPPEQRELIPSLLFEIGNLRNRDRFFTIYWTPNLSIDSFVEAVEGVEHDTLKEIAIIVSSFVREGKLSQDAHYQEQEVINDFAEHYIRMQATGHSALIAQDYEDNYKREKTGNPNFQGTHNVVQLSSDEKQTLIGVLDAKRFTQNTGHKTAVEIVQAHLIQHPPSALLVNVIRQIFPEALLSQE